MYEKYLLCWVEQRDLREVMHLGDDGVRKAFDSRGRSNADRSNDLYSTIIVKSEEFDVFQESIAYTL